MTKRKKASEDPVVAEVRSVRARLWKEAGGTAAGYVKLMRELSARRRSAATKPKASKRSSSRRKSA